MQAFSLDSEGGIPVKMQLKAHIKYQITTGMLRPGDQLPPLRDLATGLGINLNTVVRAVNDLETEGFLFTHQGKGVFVVEEFPGQGHGAAMRSLFAGVFQPAREWGMHPAELALALLSHAQLAKPPQAAPFRLLLVGGSRPQLRRLQGELEVLLPVIVEPVLAEDVSEKARTGEFRTVATTLFHEPEVRAAFPRSTVAVLASEEAQNQFASFQKLNKEAVVAIAARDWLHAARVRRSLEVGLQGSARVTFAVGQSAESVAHDLAEATHVLATPDCREIARQALAGRSDVPFLAEPLEVPGPAVAAIRRGLGVPTVEQRVHIRSAWV